MKQPSSTECAWQAGIFEGEGSVEIGKGYGSNLPAMSVNISNTDRALILPFLEHWGGKVSAYSGTRPNRRPAWRWRASARQAESFLNEILPFIHSQRVEKKITLALEFQEQKGARGYTTKEAHSRRQWDYYERMKVLNRRGNQSAKEPL